MDETKNYHFFLAIPRSGLSGREHQIIMRVIKNTLGYEIYSLFACPFRKEIDILTFIAGRNQFLQTEKLEVIGEIFEKVADARVIAVAQYGLTTGVFAVMSQFVVYVFKLSIKLIFSPQYRNLIDELGVCVESVTYLETLCKREGFGLRTNALCQHHIIRNLIGNATNRRACVGLRMLDYFKRQAAVLNDSRQIRNISSDIIESEFGILKSKVSSNKLNGFTRMILMLPLYPKIVVYSDAKKQNFKVRLANVKLKDIDLWAKENLSPNRVVLRSRTLNNAS